MVDDGESLTPYQNGPSEIPAAELDGFPARLRADIAETEAKLNEDTAAASGENRVS